MAAQHRYLFCLKPSFDGPLITSWHELTRTDAEEASTVFALNISAQVNAATGPLLVRSEVPWSMEIMEQYVRSLTPIDFKQFVAEAQI